MIRPLIHPNAIASSDWRGKSVPVPLHHSLLRLKTKIEVQVLHLLRWFTRTNAKIASNLVRLCEYHIMGAPARLKDQEVPAS